MKKYILIIVAFQFIAIDHLQAQANSVSTTGKWGQQIFLSDVNGGAFENKYADINGSAYLFPDFKFATIELADGRKYANVKARLNLVEHEVNFIASNGEEGYIGKGMVKSFLINDTTRQGIKTYSFQTGFPKTDNQTVIHFYQILASGKIALVKSINKNIEERLNELSGEKSKEFAVRENLYLLIGGELKRVKKEASFFLSAMEDKKELVSQFISSNKLNFKTEDQLLRVVEYYNSL